ncbi:MAG TPA: peptide chain release factor N(5)-glutamine methyltransferase [Pontiella sp.]
MPDITVFSMDILDLKKLSRRFSAAGIDNAKRIAEELSAHILNCKPLEVYLPDQTFNGEQLEQLESAARRIEKGEPLQYVIGHVNFWGLKIKCDSRALIPRPETELLVEEVLCSKVWQNNPATVVDVGTGSGCIAVTLAKQRPDAGFKAVDISPDALELARENAQAHGVDDRIFWMENHLLDRFAPESADVIVANLPYIASEEWKKLSPAVRDFEPQTALDSGPSGMELISELATQARYVLVPGGMLFLEFGYDQGRMVHDCLERLGYTDIEIKHDLADLDRIAIAVNPSSAH